MPVVTTLSGGKGSQTKDGSIDELTRDDHSRDIDKQAWGVASKSREARALIFDAYLDNILIRLDRIGDSVKLDDVKDVIKTSQSYLRTLSRDPVSRMFIGYIVMSFRNNFQDFTPNKINTIKRGIQKFYTSKRDIESYRQFLGTVHAIGITSIKKEG